MATNPTVLKINAVIENLQGLNQLKTALRKVRSEAKAADNNFKTITADIVDITKESGNSINSLNAQRQAFDALRNSVDTTSKEFRRATREIENLDKKLAKAQGRRPSGGRLAGAGKALGAIGAAGIFGGPEGAIGAAVGAIGGPPGIALGAAVGTGFGSLRKTAGAAGEYVAELNLAKTTLAATSANQDQYNRSLEFARKISSDYTVSLRETIAGYASVSAAARANGLSLKDTETIYRGIIASGVAFGKSQEDLNAIILATTQVLSKGKVTAEEMQGQIGERLPGAIAKFAQATNRTLPELAKAFQDGKVSVADFVKFTDRQLQDYDEIAKIIGASPEKAGARLAIALETAQENFGGFFQLVGAAFQDNLTQMLSWVNKNAEYLKRYVTFFINVVRDVKKAFGSIAPWVGAVTKSIFDSIANVALFGPRLIAKAFGTTPEKMFGNLAAGVKQAYMEYTSNFQQYFKEFTPESFGKNTAQTPGPGGGDQGAGKPDKTAKRIAAQQFRGLEKSFAEVARLRLAKETFEAERKIAAAQMEGNESLVFQLKQKLQVRKLDLNIEALQNQIAKRAEQIASFKKKGVDVTDYENEVIQDQNSLLIVQDQKQTLLAKQATERFLFEQKIAKKIADQTKSFEQQFTDRQRQLGLISESDYNKILLGREKARLDREFSGVSEEQRAQMLDLYRQEIDPTPFEKMRQNITQLREALGELVDPVNQITNAANAIGDAFATSFIDAISGAKTAQEALADFFRSLSSYFLDMAKQIIAKMIQIAILNTVVKIFPGMTGGVGGFNLGSTPFGGGSGGAAPGGDIFAAIAARGGLRANGGPVSGGTPYIVGERGPELFIPNRSGIVAPNSSLGNTNIVVNVDATGSSVQGDKVQSDKLGKAIGVAVQAELIKQKRPGGLLSS